MPRPTPEIYSRNYKMRDWNGGGYYAETLIPLTYFFREYYGSQTPGYKSKRLHRQLPNNPYSVHGYRLWTSSMQTYRYRLADGLLLAANDSPASSVAGAMPFSTFPSNLVREAENKAFQRVAKQLSAVKVNVAEFFGERKQTATMIATTVTRLASAASSLKRADLKGFVQSLSLTGRGARVAADSWYRVQKTPVWKRIPDHWLEYVYGWRPLLSDIHSAAQMLSDYAGTHPYVGRVHGSATVKQQISELDPRGSVGHLAADRVFKHAAVVRVTGYYACESQLSSILAQTGITNPLLLAWELTPYSFVVDWLYPVGDFLESLTAFDGFNCSNWVVSTLKNSGFEGSAFGWLPGPGEIVIGGDCGGYEYSYSRELRPPTFNPVIRSPIGGEPLSRFATAMSLLVQFFKH